MNKMIFKMSTLFFFVDSNNIYIYTITKQQQQQQQLKIKKRTHELCIGIYRFRFILFALNTLRDGIGATLPIVRRIVQL